MMVDGHGFQFSGSLGFIILGVFYLKYFQNST